MDKKERLGNWQEREVEDRNRDGIRDDIEAPIPDIAEGSRKLRERLENNNQSDPSLSGGDIDAQWEMADSAGDETVGGSTPTPGQSVVDDIGRGMGVTYADDEELKVGEKERSRDIHRWELDPASSEDYKDRTREQK
jgi:hypothetical protein